jgi:tetratricopeptide (TPR) repeat protein
MVLEQALELSRVVGDRAREARVLSNLGGIAVHQADAAAAHTYLEQAVAIHRSLGEATLEVRCLNNLNALAISQGNFAAAQASVERAIALSRELGNRTEEANAVSHLACLAQHSGDYAVAQALHEQALIAAQEFGVRGFELEELRQLGAVGIARGELKAARALLLQALACSRELGNLHEIAECLDFTAMLAVEELACKRAATLAGAADALHEATATPRAYAEREYHNVIVGKCRERLGEVATAKAIAAGRSLTSDQAAKEALTWLEHAG